MTLLTRKIVFFRETLMADQLWVPSQTITRVAAAAVVKNPFAGRQVDDISELFEVGRQIGEQLMGELAASLPGAPVSYGKAAIVGVDGDMEHGGATVHPKLGKPMRDACGGGEAVISSNVKIAPVGTAIDLPLGHKDNPWSFDHFDTMTVAVSDAPKPDEIVIVMALADGGRPQPRVGSGPVTT
jgi:hypothetical protein